MKTTVMYIATTVKTHSDVACFAIAIGKKNAKRMQEHAGMFQNNGRTSAQLKAMIHGLSLVEPCDSLLVYTDSTVFDHFSNGNVGTWELADWCKGNGQSIDHSDLWAELSAMVEKLNVAFVKPANKKEMSAVNALLSKEKGKPELFMNLNLGSLTEKYSLDVDSSPVAVEEEMVHPGQLDLYSTQLEKEPVKKEKTSKAGRKAEKTKAVDSVEETIPETAPKAKGKPGRKPKKKVEDAIAAPVVQETPVGDLAVATTMTADHLVIGETGKKGKKQSSEASETVSSQGITIALDEKTLKEYDKLFGELGLDTETAVKLFLKQSLRTRSIPFDLKLT